MQHYGLRTCLYGTLLPGPDIGKRCAALMRSIRDSGYEVGIHSYDHVSWQDNVAHRDQEWTMSQLRAAYRRFEEIFGEPATVHGAAGWQMNETAFLAQDILQFTHASDTRGVAPFYPVIDGKTLKCLQLPTTLPTLDELLGREDLSDADPVTHLLTLTERSRGDHVYTLHAELEGMRLAPWFERLLVGWRAQGYRFTSLGGLAGAIDLSTVPCKAVNYATVPGRSGTLAFESSFGQGASSCH